MAVYILMEAECTSPFGGKRRIPAGFSAVSPGGLPEKSGAGFAFTC